MKAAIVLADAVSFNQDGTFSLLRGGIDKLWVPPGKPFMFQGGIVVRFVAGASEVGQHTYKLVCTNDDGIPIGFQVAGTFEMKEPGGGSVCFNVQIIFPKPGVYTFSANADGHELDTYAINVKEGTPPSKEAR